jgi:outer membrane protein assembly factor BamB
MSEDRELLEQAERQFAPPPRGFDALVERRARKERRRRIGAAALALALAAGAAAVVAVTFHERSQAPATPSPAPGIHDVGRLRIAWTARVGGISGSPVEAGGRVYVGTLDGKVSAYADGCRTDGRACRPLWVGVTRGALGFGSPTVDARSVYVGSNDGSLYAFPVDCGTGGGRCRPLWTFRTSRPLGSSSPAVGGGEVFVAADRLYAVDAATGRLRWTAPVDARTASIDSASPAVVGGTVFATSTKGVLFAFPVACGSGGATCSPLWVAHLPTDQPSRPVVAGTLVVVRDGNEVLAFPVGCATGGAECRPLWTGRVPGAVPVPPAVDGGLVYATSNGGTIRAFAVRCGVGGAACRPTWSLHRRVWQNAFPAPVAWNGVVYVLWGSISAIRPGCHGAGCQPLWEYGPWGGQGGAVVSDAGVFVVSGDVGRASGTLVAFELPPSSRG